MKVRSKNLILFLVGFIISSVGGYYLYRYFRKQEIIKLHGKEAWHDTATGVPKTAMFEALMENTWWTPSFVLAFGLLVIYAAFQKDKNNE